MLDLVDQYLNSIMAAIIEVLIEPDHIHLIKED